MAAPDTTISPPRTGRARIAQGKAQRSPGAGYGLPREPRRGRATIASRRMGAACQAFAVCGRRPPQAGLGYPSARSCGAKIRSLATSAGHARTPPRVLPGLPEQKQDTQDHPSSPSFYRITSRREKRGDMRRLGSVGRLRFGLPALAGLITFLHKAARSSSWRAVWRRASGSVRRELKSGRCWLD